MATSTARRRRAVEHLIVTDFARDRLARAAFDAIAGPIQRAADHALDTLVVDLIDELGAGRPDLVARLLAPAGEAGGLGAGRHAADQLAPV